MSWWFQPLKPSSGPAGVTTSFTADAVVLATISTSLTADAFIGGSGSAAFTADATLLSVRSASFTADAFVRFVFTADAIKRQGRTASFTANALKSQPRSASFTADAYIPLFRQRHIRTGPHIGVDTDLDHTIAWAFDRYLRGENLQQTLIDIDARLTAREGGFLAQRHLLPTDAILKVLDQAASFTADAYAIIRVLTSFTADAIIPRFFRGDSWIVDPAIYLDDNVLTAPTWPIDTTPRAAFISTASLTHDPTNDPEWYWGDPTPYVTAWAKFTLSSTKTVILDTVMTGGDSVIELWEGGPPSWPSDPIGFGDEEVPNEESPYPNADRIEIELTAGTYWVLVHKWDEGLADFNILLRMQTTT